MRAVVMASVAAMMAWIGCAHADAPLDLARALVEAEEFDKALTALKQVDVAEGATAIQVDLLIGRIYLSLGKPGKALEYFEHASFSSAATETEASLGMAEAKLALGDLAQARRLATQVLKTSPDQVAAHLVLAGADRRIGKPAEAMARLRQLQRDRPESEDVAMVLARHAAQQGGPLAGVRELDAFVVRHPDAAAVQDLRGQLLWETGQTSEAVMARTRARALYQARGQNARAEAMAIWLASVGMTPAERPAPVPPPPSPPVEARPLPAPMPAPSVQAVRKTQPAMPLPRPEPLPFPPGSPIMTGSGIVLEGGRQIVTNRHVVDGMAEIAVRNGTGHTRKARLVKTSQDDDLALLEMDSSFPEGAATPYADLVDPAPGRSAVVMGFPLIGVLGDEQPALTEGIVAKTMGLGNDPYTFQITAKINKGNSGGPVFDRKGRLMGVAVGKMDAADVVRKSGSPAEDMNLGIKAGRILRFLGRNPVAAQDRPDFSLEDLYQEMLPRAVLVAARR